MKDFTTFKMKLITSFYLLILISQTVGKDYALDLDGDNQVDFESIDDDQFIGPSNVTILWKEFGFRMVCDEDEWKGQFNSIKSQMIECLEINDIIYEASDEDEFQRQRKLSTISGKPAESPYCWLAKNWRRCSRLMAGLECIEPNPKSLLTNRSNRMKEMISAQNEFYSDDPYDWRNMMKPYDILCDMVKTSAKNNIFESLGTWF